MTGRTRRVSSKSRSISDTGRGHSIGFAASRWNWIAPSFLRPSRNRIDERRLTRARLDAIYAPRLSLLREATSPVED